MEASSRVSRARSLTSRSRYIYVYEAYLSLYVALNLHRVEYQDGFMSPNNQRRKVIADECRKSCAIIPKALRATVSSLKFFIS